MKLTSTSTFNRARRSKTQLSNIILSASAALLLCVFSGTQPADATLPSPPVTHIYSFTAFNTDGVTNTDGSHPWAPLLYDAVNGLLYGVAADGGPSGSGTLFSIDSSGKLSVLHAFSALDSKTATNSDGAHPYAPLSLGSGGLIYGTTNGGGSGASGTVFSYAPSTDTFFTIYTFTARKSNGQNNDGAVPNGGIIQASDGDLYGTASFGGRFATGTIYEVAASSGFKTLWSFGAETPTGVNNRFAGGPYAQLLEFPAGTLWGSASYGGITNHGYLFTITMATGAYAVMHTFEGSTSYFNTDGANAMGLVPVPGGYMIGTTSDGGTGGDGNVFKMSATGAYTKWHEDQPLNFQGINVQGAFPSAPIADSLGNVYYTVSAGASEGHGGVVKLTSAGAFRFLAHTYPTEGGEPHGALALTPANKLYGITTNGGANGTGSIFEVPTTVK